jgi:hypothetical protein
VARAAAPQGMPGRAGLPYEARAPQLQRRVATKRTQEPRKASQDCPAALPCPSGEDVSCRLDAGPGKAARGTTHGIAAVAVPRAMPPAPPARPKEPEGRRIPGESVPVVVADAAAAASPARRRACRARPATRPTRERASAGVTQKPNEPKPRAIDGALCGAGQGVARRADWPALARRARTAGQLARGHREREDGRAQLPPECTTPAPKISSSFSARASIVKGLTSRWTSGSRTPLWTMALRV